MRAQIAALTAERDTLRVVVDTLNEYAPCWESIVDDEDAVIIRSAIARAAGEEKGRG